MSVSGRVTRCISVSIAPRCRREVTGSIALRLAVVLDPGADIAFLRLGLRLRAMPPTLELERFHKRIGNTVLYRSVGQEDSYATLVDDVVTRS
jgi:hypothetical protein